MIKMVHKAFFKEIKQNRKKTNSKNYKLFHKK